MSTLRLVYTAADPGMHKSTEHFVQTTLRAPIEVLAEIEGHNLYVVRLSKGAAAHYPRLMTKARQALARTHQVFVPTIASNGAIAHFVLDTEWPLDLLHALLGSHRDTRDEMFGDEMFLHECIPF